MSDLSQQALEDATGSWSPAVRYLEETDSTNRVAMEWADQGAPEGCLVVADFQTAGRGRLDRAWFSPAGASLLFSLILKPGIVVEDVGILSLAGAAAVCGALGGVGADPRIKWPNDVRLNGRKVAGILAEASVEIGRAVSVVLGVGINVSIEEEDFPADLRDLATSLLRETGSRPDRIEILCGFLRSFGQYYTGLPTRSSQRILEAYRPLCETLGRDVRVELGDRTIEGKAVDVEASGGLVLSTGDTVRAGDVIHLR